MSKKIGRHRGHDLSCLMFKSQVQNNHLTIQAPKTFLNEYRHMVVRKQAANNT